MYQICFLCSNLRRTGPTRQLLNILNHLDTRLFDARVLTLSKEPEDSLASEFFARGITVECLGVERVAGWFTGVSKLNAWLKRSKVDLLHSQGVRADQLSVGLKNRLRCVSTMRNDPKVDYVLKYGRFFGSGMSVRHLSLLRQLTVVSCSQHVQERLQSYGVASICIPNGVEEPRTAKHIRKIERERIRSELGLVKDLPVLVTVGSLIERKNVGTLIRAVDELNNRTDCSLIIVGDGPARSELEKIHTKHRRHQFVGQSEAVTEYLAAADVFVSASFSEGLPNAALEALASGLPCVLSDIPPHAELSKETSDVTLCEVLSSAQFAQVIEELLSSKKKKNSEQNYRSLLPEVFQAEAMSRRYQTLYLDILNAE